MPEARRLEARLTDVVYDRLRNSIFAGSIAPGQRLSVPALAAELEVSRSPVREAVRRLTEEGLAREEPRRGAVVARIDTDELVRLYEVREVLEGLAARLAVEHSGRLLVDRLAAVLADHERAVDAADVAAHFEADMRFHRLIREAGRNPEAARLLDQLQARVRLAMLTTSVTGGPRHALEDHRRIYEAIARGDPRLAEHAAREHVVRLREALRQRMSDKEPDLW